MQQFFRFHLSIPPWLFDNLSWAERDVHRTQDIEKEGKREGGMTLPFSKKWQIDWLTAPLVLAGRHVAPRPPPISQGVDAPLPYDLATIEASHRRHGSLICVCDSVARPVPRYREQRSCVVRILFFARRSNRGLDDEWSQEVRKIPCSEIRAPESRRRRRFSTAVSSRCATRPRRHSISRCHHVDATLRFSRGGGIRTGIADRVSRHPPLGRPDRGCYRGRGSAIFGHVMARYHGCTRAKHDKREKETLESAGRPRGRELHFIANPRSRCVPWIWRICWFRILIMLVIRRNLWRVNEDFGGYLINKIHRAMYICVHVYDMSLVIFGLFKMGACPFHHENIL